VKLDKASSVLTTFDTPFGRYRYNRLPFCHKIFFKNALITFSVTYMPLHGCAGIADDLVIAGWNEDGSDHDATPRTVLEHARTSGTRFNDE